MTREELRKRLSHEILILDGAMGSLLMNRVGHQACLEDVARSHPEILREIHKAYDEAGADIVSSNTFGGNRIKLANYGLEAQAGEINKRAAALAREAVSSETLIAGSVGPTGRIITPLGDLSFDEAYEAFREQAMALESGGADLLLLETFGDLKEVKIAIMAARENTSLPVLAAMTFEEGFTSFTGTDPETAAVLLSSLGADGIGVNCSTGPEPMLEVVGRYTRITEKPVFVEPNAGLPRREGKKTSYLVTPEVMAEHAGKYVQLGANIVGSCCGSTPEYTRAIAATVKGFRPVSRQNESVFYLASRNRSVAVGAGLPFAVIGERINPTNREDLAEALRSGRVGAVIREAQQQASEGAMLLDVNVGVPGIDETEILPAVVEGIEGSVVLPLCLDCTNPGAIEAALRSCAGKPLINSVNGSEDSLEAMLPLARRHGAALLCLAVDKAGIPKTAAERLAVIKKIVRGAEEAGIPRNNLICDCLTLTVSAQQKRVEATLEAVRMVHRELGLPTVLGVSNISYGLPERSLINSVFLSMAMGAGLDAAIMNPSDRKMMETVRAASVLTVRDKDSQAFVASHQRKKKSKTSVAAQEQSSDNAIFQAVLNGNRKDIAALVEKALTAGESHEKINTEILIPAIQEVGGRYDRKEIFLPQMILAAETMQAGFEVLKPYFKGDNRSTKGTVVLCTVKGDVHDIGKNIVGLFLKNNGFSVIDLGKDMSAETILRQALDSSADIVALSALMTTTMVEMPKVIQMLREGGCAARILVGGAVITKQYSKEIGADGFAKDGPGAVTEALRLVDAP